MFKYTQWRLFLVCIGGDTFDVLVKRAGKASTTNAVRGRVEDLGEGLYKASYIANFSGTYEVHVTCGGAYYVDGDLKHIGRGSRNSWGNPVQDSNHCAADVTSALDPSADYLLYVLLSMGSSLKQCG